jgi:hypothetical protein
MWKGKDDEQFRQVVCEHSGIVTRQQMRVTDAKYLGEPALLLLFLPSIHRK